MKVNYIDKNGNKTIKNIDVDFKNIAKTDMKNIFKRCTYLTNIPKIDFSNVKKNNIMEIWKNCKI